MNEAELDAFSYEGTPPYWGGSYGGTKRGVESINLHIFLQDKIWIDSRGHVWSLVSLQDDHLNNILKWIDDNAYGLNVRASDEGIIPEKLQGTGKWAKNSPLYLELAKIQNMRAFSRFRSPQAVIKNYLDSPSSFTAAGRKSASSARLAADLVRGIEKRGWKVVKS